ncbi:MAG: CoA transferase [Rhizobiales bacterium]|nr:CoA transferase [Hyphomicrobiales bacterium]
MTDAARHGDGPGPGGATAPLAGIRVLDLTRVMAGPFATALLGDLGADIIKLEPPGGDDYRHIGPFVTGESALFLLMNRGKRSVVLDLKHAEARALARQLALSCDVVVENFRPGVAARLGLGPTELREEKPSLVYASISGFGQDGPFADRPAYDLIVQALSGLMAATGEEGGAPLKVGESFGDLAAGLFASWAILAALLRRERTGEGAHIDVAMFDSLFSLLPTSHAVHQFTGRVPERVGNRHPLSTPFGAYRARNGHVVIAVLNEAQFGRFAALLGHAGLGNDPRFASDEARTRNEAVLRPLIEAWTETLEVEELVAALSREGIAAAPILDIAEASAGAHAGARGLVERLPHASLGTVANVGQPVRFDGVKFGADRGAPLEGADTLEVLRSLVGVSEETCARLVAEGAIRPGCDQGERKR